MINDNNKSRVEYAALFSILCTMAGTGILQLPLTLKQGGWVCLSLIIVVALMTNTTGKWLIKCLYERGTSNGKQLLLQPSARLNDYPSIGDAAYGFTGKCLVQIFHKLTLIGVTTIFLILSAKFLMEGIGGSGEGFISDLGTANDASLWQTRWTLITAVIVAIPVTLIPNMSEMHALAAFGLFCTLLCVIEIVVFAILFKPLKQETVNKYNLPTPEYFNSTHLNGETVSHSYFNIREFPTSFAAITLSFGGHAVFPSIEKHMQDPNLNFNKTFNTSYVLLLIVYLIAAIFGYLTFGDITYSPILCNFPRDTSTALGAITATTKLMIAFHVMSAYPILMNVVCTELEQTLEIENDNETNNNNNNNNNGKNDCKKTFARFCLRLSLVGLTSFIAIMVPYFPDVMSLVGAMCLTMIVFILPVIFSFKLRGQNMTFLEKFWGICIVCCGSVGGFIGTIQAFQSIALKLASSAPPG